MDSDERSKVIAFDTLFCTNHIQMLKIILPYMDSQMQKSLAIYIKFLELNYTIEYFKRHPFPLCGCAEKEPSHDISKMCRELLPFCTGNEKKQIEQILNMIQSMDMYREMSKTMDIMKDFMPDAESQTSAGSGGGFDMMNLLMNMLTPEQKQMYEMFGGDYHAE